MDSVAISLRSLSFRYEESPAPVIRDLSLDISAGARVLLSGANGSGKSTLLRILSGLHLVPDPAVRIFGRSAFSDLGVGRQIAWVGGDFELNLDLRVSEVLGWGDASPSASDRELLELFGVDLNWRMHRVSEGQRRRVQLFLGLRNREARILLLDEVTAHLDVTMRSDLVDWLKRESEAHGKTILYCTHIFDGLSQADGTCWATDLLWLGNAGQSKFVSAFECRESIRLRGGVGRLVEDWIRGK